MLSTFFFPTKVTAHFYFCLYKYIYIYNVRFLSNSDDMSENVSLSLVTLPVELVYRILDHLDNFSILVSARNICTRLNTIIDSYYPYQVKFSQRFHKTLSFLTIFI